MFTHLSILECVPTHRKLSLILNTPLQTQLPIVGLLVWTGLRLEMVVLLLHSSVCFFVILPLKLGRSAMERPRFVVNCRSLSTHNAFVKMSTIYKFVLMCCRSASPARTLSKK